ncbi:MAG: 2'-5' RNA ligase family protein [Chloroflexi bacterium]|nr:2'-5' RNA ligase family protein [Chloroflexota bacterium]
MPEMLVDQFSRVEKAADQRRAKIPAHITVKGTFYGHENLDGLKNDIRDIATRHEPFFLGFHKPEVTIRNGTISFVFTNAVETEALNNELESKIGPASKSAYRSGPYKTHLCVVEQVDQQGTNIAADLIPGLDLGGGVEVDSLELMGRDGPAYGGTWKRLERFGLGR